MKISIYYMRLFKGETAKTKWHSHWLHAPLFVFYKKVNVVWSSQDLLQLIVSKDYIVLNCW